MVHKPKARHIALTASVLLLTSLVCHAQVLPPSTPTQSQQITTQTSTPLQSTSRAHVDYTSGNLAITADNSSLNQILSEVARLTGMKITGGVREEHVFGTYGPGPAQEVLTQLLEGTGSNVLLFEDAQHRVRQLVLSPRTGGATPPSPSSPVADRLDHPDRDLPPDPNLRHRGFDRSSLPNHSPYSQGAPPVTGVPPSGSDNTTTQQSPNGVKTPQQIYDELIQKQMQAPQPATPPTGPPSPSTPPSPGTPPSS